MSASTQPVMPTNDDSMVANRLDEVAMQAAVDRRVRQFREMVGPNPSLHAIQWALRLSGGLESTLRLLRAAPPVAPGSPQAAHLP